MNRSQRSGKWKQFVGSVKEAWARFRDDSVGVVAAKSEQVVGAVEESIGNIGEAVEATAARRQKQS